MQISDEVLEATARALVLARPQRSPFILTETEKRLLADKFWQQEIPAARAALEAALPMIRAGVVGEWQDISTAPKDGTRVLLLTGRSEVAVGFWGINKSHLYLLSQWLTDLGPSSRATHWMPLPAPPREDGR
jgi:hypothetical protein